MSRYGSCTYCGYVVKERHETDTLGLLCGFCSAMVPRIILEGQRQHPQDDRWMIAARMANFIRDPECVAKDKQ